MVCLFLYIVSYRTKIRKKIYNWNFLNKKELPCRTTLLVKYVDIYYSISTKAHSMPTRRSRSRPSSQRYFSQ